MEHRNRFLRLFSVMFKRWQNGWWPTGGLARLLVFAWCDGNSCLRDGWGFLEVWFLRGVLDGVGLDFVYVVVRRVVFVFGVSFY